MNCDQSRRYYLGYLYGGCSAVSTRVWWTDRPTVYVKERRVGHVKRGKRPGHFPPDKLKLELQQAL